MKRFLIAAGTAAALALTPAASRPAQAADGTELLGLLLGIGTVYAIGKGIERSREPLTPPQLAGERRDPTPGWSSAAPGRTVPRECLSRFDTRAGDLAGFGADCLGRWMWSADHLPAECAVETRFGAREETVYAARCLQLRGWQAVQGRADAPRLFEGRHRPMFHH